MNLKKYSTKITEHKLTDNQWEICLQLYIATDFFYPKKIIDNDVKHLKKLKLIEIIYDGDLAGDEYSLTKNMINKLDSVLLHHTNKQQWNECMLRFYPYKKINDSLYPNISFLNYITEYRNENYLAFWSDTLKIGKIIHPDISYHGNYNEFMTTLISQEQLKNTIQHPIINKQKAYKI